MSPLTWAFAKLKTVRQNEVIWENYTFRLKPGHDLFDSIQGSDPDMGMEENALPNSFFQTCQKFFLISDGLREAQPLSKAR